MNFLKKRLGGTWYQITPIQLVQWAEPLFGRDGRPARGIPEEQIVSFETAVGIRLPGAFREYLLACGGASLNRMLDRIQLPEMEGRPFQDHLTFSYEYLEDELECSDPEEDNPEQKRFRALPRERWGEVTGNYLQICLESQGGWAAGIRAEDLDQPDPVVWRDDDNPFPPHWVKMHDSVSAMLMGVILVAIQEKSTAETKYLENPEEIRAALKKNRVDFDRLRAAPPFAGGEQVHTCLNTRSNTLFVYHEADGELPEALTVIRECPEGRGG
ncbi:SMI1/KNR4 family protein [Oscillospiraceae bacterium 38-13]|jgi:hypothetical protein